MGEMEHNVVTNKNKKTNNFFLFKKKMTRNKIYTLLVELEGLMAVLTPLELAQLLKHKDMKDDTKYEEAITLLIKLLTDNK